MTQKLVFLKPGDNNIFSEDRTDIDKSSNTTFIYNPLISQSIERQRQRLPVFNSRNQILYLVEKYQTTIIVGETGCGKSTQIPQYLLEAGWGVDGIIGITEPRRVACTSLASRVAEERNTLLGKEVGYSIRFDDCTQPTITKIKYLTEALLVREMMADPLLRQYCVLVLDEVHERTLYTDIVLGLLKKILKRRKDLRVVVCSATVDADHLKCFFNLNKTKDDTKDTSVALSIEGRNYPVDVHYLLEPCPDYVKGSIDTVLKIHRTDGPGDVLIFLTGVEEVDKCVELLHDHIESMNKNEGTLVVLPMHGSLPNHDQLRVFQSCPIGTRKVIVATNIAETSITIPGIVYVIDCGFVKVRWYFPDSNSDALIVVPTSRAAATQRAGRAGRMRSGKVYRLYQEDEVAELPAATPPEMVRSNLSSAVLNLMALGIDNMLRFEFPSPPPARHMTDALDQLFALGAITDNGQLSQPLGQHMAEFPLSPLLSKMLLESDKYECSAEILSIVSMLQVQNIFIIPSSGQHAIQARIRHRRFQVTEGDLLTLLNVYQGYEAHLNHAKHWCSLNYLNYKALKRAQFIRNSMQKLLTKCDVSMTTSEKDSKSVCKCITAGLFPNAAYLHYTGEYHLVRGDQVLHIHPSSVLYTQKQPQWVLFHEILHTRRVYMRDLTVIDPQWLLELAPHFYENSTLDNR